jgi:hypothetical protein
MLPTEAPGARRALLRRRRSRPSSQPVRLALDGLSGRKYAAGEVKKDIAGGGMLRSYERTIEWLLGANLDTYS